MSDTYKLQRPDSAEHSRQTAPPGGQKSTKAMTARKAAGRLVSLDAYRGFIMTMLAASGFGIARLASLPHDNSVWNVFDYDSFQTLKFHFSHPPWESISGLMGVAFWDLIQPCFMFMVGVAMPFSYARRQALGGSKRGMAMHAIVRAVVLTLMGVFLYSLSQSQTNWMFTNVLAQIGLGYFFAFLLLGRRPGIQLAAIGIILTGYWGLFVMNPPERGFDYGAGSPESFHGEVFWGLLSDERLPENYEIPSIENNQIYEGRFAPWSKNSNVAHKFDVWLLNQLRQPGRPAASAADGGVQRDQRRSLFGNIRKWWFSAPDRHVVNRGGYVTLSFIPSIATTLLGVLCGQLLMGADTNARKLWQLIVWGGVCLGLGVLAHHSVCPIVKRIWTPSWVLFSGGYAIWLLATFYFLFDVLPLKLLALPLVVVGMNSIVMYMMGQMLRPWVTEKVVRTHFGELFKTVFGPGALDSQGIGAVVLPTATFLVFWLIALWMYRARLFVRI